MLMEALQRRPGGYVAYGSWRSMLSGPVIRNSPKTWPVLLVAVLHALLLLVILRHQAWRDQTQSAQTQLPLFVLFQGEERSTPELPQPVPGQRPQIPPAPNLRVPDVDFTPLPALITQTQPAPAPAAPTAKAEVVPPSREPPASAPLNLTLPRGLSARAGGTLRDGHDALHGPWGSKQTPNLEGRIAAALGGTDQISETRLADGSLRLKRGSACVLVRPNRAGALDPYNASAQPRPRLVESC